MKSSIGHILVCRRHAGTGVSEEELRMITFLFLNHNNVKKMYDPDNTAFIRYFGWKINKYKIGEIFAPYFLSAPDCGASFPRCA